MIIIGSSIHFLSPIYVFFFVVTVKYSENMKDETISFGCVPEMHNILIYWLCFAETVQANNNIIASKVLYCKEKEQ